MDLPDATVLRLDSEFDQLLVGMKPYVLRLPHKSERQRSALWIKKFCEPPLPGVTGRKNRNMYAQLMWHMLQKGVLEGPFNQRPEPGPLPTLPTYMSIYYDDTGQTRAGNKENRVPDWVTGELGSADITGISSIPPVDPSYHRTTTDFTSSLRDKYGSGPLADKFGSDLTGSLHDTRRKDPSDAWLGFPRERSLSPQRTRPPFTTEERVPPLHPEITTRPAPLTVFPLLEDDTTSNIDVDFTRPKTRHPPKPKEDEWKNVTFASSTFQTTTGGGTLFKDDSAMTRINEKELEMRTKVLEAKFQEDKLKLQQKHDATVQKILDRKNTEIEDIKTHYRKKKKVPTATLR